MQTNFHLNFKRFHCCMLFCKPFHYNAPHKNKPIFLVDFGNFENSELSYIQQTAFGLSCCNLLCAQRFYLVFRYINTVNSFLLTGTAESRISYPCCPFDTSKSCAFLRPRVVGEHISFCFVRSPARFFFHISKRRQRVRITEKDGRG